MKIYGCDFQLQIISKEIEGLL